VVTRTDYNQIAVKAAYSVLLEIIRILGEYKDNIVLIGGWVAKNFASEEHTGPKFVTAFEEITDEEDRIQMERDAYERVNYLLLKLGLIE